tara:strand:+ start:1 stop:1263 length:1263 start_codon:yes stop_codon:yes gene_type:complete
MDIQYLKCLSTIDFKYRKEVENLYEYFTEISQYKYFILIEIEYLICLGKLDIFDTLEDETINDLRDIYKKFDSKEYLIIKENDESFIKYIKNKILEKNLDKTLINFIHLGISDEDILLTSNIFRIKKSISNVILPQINNCLNKIKEKILEWAKIPLLSIYNGIKGEPTFLGKEFLVFYERIIIQSRKLNNIKYTTKIGGKNGNFNRHHMALPNIDWIDFFNKFVKIFSLERNQYTTGLDHFDNYIEIFDLLKRINNIFIDFCEDLWNYISREIFNSKHLIIFEEAEANFHLANSFLDLYSKKLSRTRVQGDNINKFLLESLGLCFSYCLIGYKLFEKGIHLIEIKKNNIEKELTENYSVILDGIKTRFKVINFYTEDNLADIKKKSDLIEKLNKFNEISIEEKKYILTITPFNFTGIYKL